MIGLRCGSLFVYATKGQTALSRSVREFVINVKQDRIESNTGRFYADLASERLAREQPPALMPFFGPEVALVPVPTSALTRPNTVWCALTLCKFLQAAGLAAEVVPMLHRAVAVRKSAGSSERPSADQHRRSFAIEPPLGFGRSRIVLVDDVVTRGCTILGAALRLREALPEVGIDAFALARVQSTGEIDVARSPKVEYLSVAGVNCRRLEEPPDEDAQPGLFG